MKQIKEIEKGISVIIPTFNRVNYLYPTLICLLNQKLDENITYEIIIIDSGSDNTKELIDYIKQNRKDITIIYRKIKKNENRSLLRNIGVDLSNYRIICFLDNDMLIPPDFIEKHYYEHLQVPHLVALGKRHSLLDYEFSKFGEDELVDNYYKLSRLPAFFDEREKLCINISPWRFLFTHSVSIEKQDFLKVGKFNLDFGNNWGYEDLELGFKLQNVGCRFKLIEGLISYHQPHFIQSLNEQHSSEENSKLFLKLHNCFEVELYNAFYSNFEEYFLILKRLQNTFILPKKKLIKRFDLIFGCIIPSLQNFSYSKIQLGCFSIYENNQFDKILILSSFFEFPKNLQISILTEALRISKTFCFININTSQIELLNMICKNIGYNISIEKKEEYFFFYKVGKLNSKVYTILLPDLLQPEKRYVYLWLADFLIRNGYYISIIENRKIAIFNNEDFSMPEDSLLAIKKCIECSYGNVDFRYIASSDMVLTNDEELVPKTLQTIILHDENFEVSNNSYKNKLLSQYTNFDNIIYSILSFLSIYKYTQEFKINSSYVNSYKEFSFYTYMENGFKEDGIDILLTVFSSLVKNNPKYSLTIKIPNYLHQLENSYPQHNNVSRNNKSFYILQKIKIDRSLLSDEIRKLNLQHNIILVEENLSIHQVIKSIAEQKCIIQMGRISCVPPQVYIAILLGKKVIIPEHQNENIVNDLKPYCEFVPTKANYFSDEMNLPNNCDYNNFIAYKIDKDALLKLLIEISTSKSSQKDLEFEEINKRYNKFIKSIF